MDEDKIRELAEMLKKRLTPDGVISEIESPTYECELCHDSLYINYRDENGYLIAKPCECYARQQAKRLLQASGLADAVDKQTFDSFVTETPLQEAMKSKAHDYLEQLLLLRGNKEIKKPWLYVGGNPGSGKTHICTAVCGELLKNNVPVRYMQWITESKPLKFSVNNDNFDDMISDYVKPSVLYIDDLFKQKYTPNPVFTDADVRVAFAIFNARYLMDKPTIISSEWDLIDHLLEADEGVFSRVYERCQDYTIIVSRKKANNYRMRRKSND